MNTLYDLVKRIDALTANSQQVLNALIRSCLATGSSSGYKVKKFTQTIEMTRADIYRLYDFYNTWEQAGFPSDESFDRLLAKADTRWHRSNSDGTQLATDAVVKHSKILYMDSANQGNSDDGFWTDKIKNSASGKAVVSTAPIPINLRTPLYDENLSVKSFSQYETYLFPIGYRRTEILGTPNNGEDYVAGGQNWEIDATDFLRLNASHITMGNVTGKSPKNANYGDSYCTFSWGDEAYSFATRAFTAGTRSISLAQNAITLGTRVLTGGIGALGTGNNTFANASYSATFNMGTVSGGPSSLAANSHAVTGGYPYSFTVRSVDPISTDGKVVCVGEGSTSGECYLADMQVNTEYANTKVLQVTVNRDGLTLPHFDLMVGDYVRIYNVYGKIDGKKVYAGDDGAYAYPVFTTKVSQISGPVHDDQSNTDEYDITLEDALPLSPYMVPAGGSIQTTQRGSLILGRNSTALNYYTLASGDMQTVVGTSNLPEVDARFIVGTGTKEITSYRDSETGMVPVRATGMSVAPKYGYLKLANDEAGFSVAASDSGTWDWDDTYHLYKGAVMRGGASMANHSRVSATEARSMMLSRFDASDVARIGTAVRSGSYSGSGFVSALFSSLQGTAVISSGSYIKPGTTAQAGLIDTLMLESKIADHSDTDHNVAVYAEDGIEIRSVGTGRHGIHIWANSYLKQSFDGLLLEGNTFGALAATDQARSFVLEQKSGRSGNTGNLDDILWGETTGHSGFYYGQPASNGFNLIGTDKWGLVHAHVFNSTIKDEFSQEYRTVTVSFPEEITAGTDSVEVLHPVVTSTVYAGVGNGNVKPISKYSKELAYKDDVAGEAGISFGKLASCGFASESATDMTFGQDTKLPVVFYDGAWSSAGILGNGTWKTDLLSMQPVSMDGYNMCDSYDIVDSTENVHFKVTGFRYSISGSMLLVSFELEFTTSMSPNSVSAICMPFMLGCGTVTNNDGFAVPGADDMRYTKLSGTMSTPGGVISYPRNINGIAYSDGMIIVGASCPSNFIAGGTKYKFNLYGNAPFIASGVCCGITPTDEWATQMYNDIESGSHLSYSTLQSTMASILDQ